MIYIQEFKPITIIDYLHFTKQDGGGIEIQETLIMVQMHADASRANC